LSSTTLEFIYPLYDLIPHLNVVIAGHAIVALSMTEICFVFPVKQTDEILTFIDEAAVELSTASSQMFQITQ
jgi:hypothetical protein